MYTVFGYAGQLGNLWNFHMSASYLHRWDVVDALVIRHGAFPGIAQFQDVLRQKGHGSWPKVLIQKERQTDSETCRRICAKIHSDTYIIMIF